MSWVRICAWHGEQSGTSRQLSGAFPAKVSLREGGGPGMLGLTSPCQEPIAIHGNEKPNQLQPRNYRTTKCCTADYEGLLDTQPTLDWTS